MSYYSTKDYLQHILRYDYAAIGLYAVALVGSLVICPLTFLKLHKLGDPARSFIQWSKVACVPLFLFISMYIISCSTLAANVQPRVDGDFSYGTPQDNLRSTQNYTAILGSLCSALTQIAVLLMIVSFEKGLSAVKFGSGAGKLERILAFVAYGYAAVLFLLTLAKFAVTCVVQYKIDHRFASSSTLYDFALVSNDVTFSYLVLILLASVAAAVWTLTGLIQGPRNHRTPAVLMLICGVLLLLTTTYNMGIWAKYNVPGQAFSEKRPEDDNYLIITNAILVAWPLVGIMVLAFVAGRKQNGGVWSDGPAGYKGAREFVG